MKGITSIITHDRDSCWVVHPSESIFVSDPIKTFLRNAIWISHGQVMTQFFFKLVAIGDTDHIVLCC